MVRRLFHGVGAWGAVLASGVVLGLVAGCSAPTAWWRGNTHTHSLWSDGDAAPEQIVDWYVSNGYDFLVLSDHNILQDHERWHPVAPDGSEGGDRRLQPAHVAALRTRFGPDWVDERPRDDGTVEMRLKTLPELRERFAEPGAFLLVAGEEVTDRFETHEIHINAVNIGETIPPQGGVSVRETLQRNIDAIIAHGAARGEPVLAHVNHPNYAWSLTAADLAAIRGDRFFEIYNGHRSVRNEGDADHPSVETLWDTALVLRRLEGAELLYGLATDDAHNHHDADGQSVPGRGWIVVRAPRLARLEEGAIIDAMRRGDFYASSGVTLTNVAHDTRSLAVSIRDEPCVTYRTEFIGTRMIDGHPGPIGAVLATSTANPAVYAFVGDELYVRARVVSSRPHPRPYAAGDLEMAWVQPVRPRDDDR